ncbi:MAG: hypothetical protein OSA47_01125 [Novosphingopyxis baekryungensis]|jgi:hypothetical protein|nr:hypothetical protein [Novosphingopyxis baekryungensis]
MFEMLEWGAEMQKAIRQAQLDQMEAAGDAIEALQQQAAERAKAQRGLWRSWMQFWGGKP